MGSVSVGADVFKERIQFGGVFNERGAGSDKYLLFNAFSLDDVAVVYSCPTVVALLERSFFRESLSGFGNPHTQQRARGFLLLCDTVVAVC